MTRIDAEELRHGFLKAPRVNEGLPCGAATSLTLGAYMGKGYARSRKTFPQGVFFGISLILSAGYTSTLL